MPKRMHKMFKDAQNVLNFNNELVGVGNFWLKKKEIDTDWKIKKKLLKLGHVSYLRKSVQN